MLTVTINGVPFGIEPASLSISDNADGRNTCTFELNSDRNASAPLVGHPVTVRWGGVKIFDGSVEEYEETAETDNVLIYWNVSCVDNNAIADRHLIQSSYENKTLQEIVFDLIAGYFAGDNVTAGTIPAGDVLEKVVFPYITGAEALNDLATLTGWTWSIDYDRALHFAPVGTFTAPFGITATTRNYRNLKVKKSRSEYRNSQLIIAGRDLTESRTEDFKGDGQNRNFVLSLPVGAEPSIEVDAAPKTVGVKGGDTGYDFYYSVDDSTISQDSAAAALTSSNVLSVTFQGLYPVYLRQQNPIEIATRAAVEGGSGVYEAVEKDESLNSRSLGEQKARGLLRRSGVIPTVLDFDTDTSIQSDAYLLRAGQVISINLPGRNLADTFFVQKVSLKSEGYTGGVAGGHLLLSVSCIDGEKSQSWQSYWASLTRGVRKTTLRGDEIFVAFRDVTGEQVDLTDSASYSTGVTSFVGFAEVELSEVAA